MHTLIYTPHPPLHSCLPRRASFAAANLVCGRWSIGSPSLSLLLLYYVLPPGELFVWRLLWRVGDSLHALFHPLHGIPHPQRPAHRCHRRKFHQHRIGAQGTLLTRAPSAPYPRPTRSPPAAHPRPNPVTCMLNAHVRARGRAPAHTRARTHAYTHTLTHTLMTLKPSLHTHSHRPIYTASSPYRPSQSKPSRGSEKFG